MEVVGVVAARRLDVTLDVLVRAVDGVVQVTLDILVVVDLELGALLAHPAVPSSRGPGGRDARTLPWGGVGRLSAR